MPRRELLLLGEMIDAAEQATRLVAGLEVESLTHDRQRRDALLWNFTVLGEAASQLPESVKQAHPEVRWSRPMDNPIPKLVGRPRGVDRYRRRRLAGVCRRAA